MEPHPFKPKRWKQYKMCELYGLPRNSDMHNLTHPLVDDTCDTCERRDNFGFHSEALARKVTSQLARGAAHPYYLVQSHTGLWYFVRAVKIDPRDREGFMPTIRCGAAIERTIQYLGGRIVGIYNSLGDKIEFA